MNEMIRRWAKKLSGRLAPELAEPYFVAPVSHAEQYPDVPKPDFGLTPSELAQQWLCQGLHGEDMPGVAADLLERGYDSPTLRRLAGVMGRPSSADVKDLIEQMLLELGVKLPQDDRLARLILTRQLAREVIAGLRNPWEAVAHVEALIMLWNSGIPELIQLAQIHEELNWNKVRDGLVERLADELVDVFARIGAATDEELARM